MIRISLFITALLLVILSGSPSTRAASPQGMAVSPWPMYQGNPAHTGRSSFRGITQQPIVLWKHQMPMRGGELSSGMSVGTNGTIYFSTGAGIIAVNSGGSVRWTVEGQGTFSSRSTPAVRADGMMYWGFGNAFALVSTEGKFVGGPYGLDTNLVFGGSPTIAPDGSVYALHDALWAFNEDASPRWLYDFGDLAYTSPALAADGTLYTTGGNAKLRAFTATGKLKWVADARVSSSSPAVGADGTIYVTTNFGELRAYTPEGTLRWSFTVDEASSFSNSLTTPAIAVDGTIYFGTMMPSGFQNATIVSMYAVNPDGTRKWRYVIERPAASFTGFTEAPIIDADGNVYGCAHPNTCYAFDHNGNLLWTYTTSFDRGNRTTPLFVDDGVLWILDANGTLHALADPRLPLLQTAPSSLETSFCNASTPHQLEIEISSSQSAVNWSASLLQPQSGITLETTKGITPSKAIIVIDPTTLPAGTTETTVRIGTDAEQIVNKTTDIPVIVRTGCKAFTPIVQR